MITDIGDDRKYLDLHQYGKSRMKHDHHIGKAFKREFADWNLWWTRSAVVTVAALAGVVVVGFTWLSEQALNIFFQINSFRWWLPLFWTPLCTAAIVWATRRHAPGAAGSGIPQVMAALDPAVGTAHRSKFVSLKLSVAKIGLTSSGLLAGLSLGREGPSVQIAAGIMLATRRWLPMRSSINEHGLLVAGGAAGIAAAFNTPLAGVMFAIEELSRLPEQRSSGLLVACIVLSGLIAVSLTGNATYFGVIHAAEAGFHLLIPGILVAVASGLTGGLFSRLVVASLNGQGSDFLSRLRRQRPIVFAGACGLIVATIGVVTGGETFGSGYSHTRHMLEGSENAPAVYVLFKFVATWITTWSGVPAGIFAPSLAIGAALGSDIAQMLHSPFIPALIALGMAGFLAAVTQAPLTSFIIVMEMVDGHAMVLSLMACCMVASIISRVLSRPLYPSLAQVQLASLPKSVDSSRHQ
jgi:H+/Cl- antiporter ClcA